MDSPRGRVGRRRPLGLWPFSWLVLMGLGVGGCGLTGADRAPDEGTASPVASLLGHDPAADPDQQAQDQLDAEQARQDIIVACMADQGFTYFPVDPASVAAFTLAGGVDRRHEAWISVYGFGISTTWLTEDEVPPGLVGRPRTEAQVVDPNREALAAMSPADQEAYTTALYGDGLVLAASPGALPGGCWGRALLGTDELARSFADQFGDELGAFYQEVEADPRVIGAADELSRCVAAEGLVYRSQDEVYQELNRGLQEVEATMSHPADELTAEDFANLSDDELDAILAQPRSLTPEGQARLGQLQADEVGLALAVHGCGGPVDHGHPVFQQVLRERQEAFLAQHQDRLDQLGHEE